MSFFKKLASIFTPGGRGGGLTQRTIDNYRASLLLSSYAKSQASGHVVQPTQEQVDAIFRDVQSWSFEEFSTFAQDEIHKQILHLFAAIESDALATKGGFSLQVRPSRMANAGNGVFVSIPPNSSLPSRTIPAGSVVALFGGLVHLTEFTTQKDYVQQTLLPDPDMQCLVRVDEPIVIDGRTAQACPPNPLALGHVVNHCGGQTKPNVLQHPYNFPHDPLDLDSQPHLSFPKHLRKLIPNAYGRKPTLLGSPDRGALMHGAVLLAARPLEDGDELLMDYRLNPAGSVPAWYEHFDSAQAEQRWKA